MVKVLLIRARVKYTHNNLAKPDLPEKHKSVVMVVGYSGKGLGAAGISKEQEIERTRALLETAEEKNIPVVLTHIGGKSRRGPSSTILLEMVSENAACMVFVEGGNPDGLLTKLARNNGFPFRSSKKITQTLSLFKELFK
ncbi:MAG: hypothetical protein GY866_10605 [Proteobacteria bacterium]|nr:hypothetical protein [Pseudomonadota bacterium]